MTSSRRTVITVGLLSSLLAACGGGGPDADRLNEVAMGVSGVTGSSLVLNKLGTGKALEGDVQLPADRERAVDVFDAVLRALADEIGPDGEAIMMYLHGVTGSDVLGTKDVGAPFNPDSATLWRHYNG